MNDRSRDFVALDLDTLPHLPEADITPDVRAALLWDIVAPKPTPTAASLGLADPRELANGALELANTMTLMAHAAEVGDVATVQDLAVAAGRADWVASQILALVALGGVR